MLSNLLLRKARPINAVIFDLDDTLIDWARPELSWPQYLTPAIAAIHGWLVEAGIDVGGVKRFGEVFGRNISTSWASARKTSLGVSMAGILHQTLHDFNVETADLDFDEILRAVDWQLMPGVVPYPDAHDVLQTLRERGYKIGLVTNAFQPMWMRDVELEAYGLMEFLDARITSGDTGYMKPHPAIYWRIMGLLDTTPDQAIFVGDRPSHDILGANEVGMTSVLMDPPHVDRKSAEIIPDYTITTLTELLPIVESLS